MASAEWQRQWVKKLKQNDPIKYAIYMEKKRLACKAWYDKNHARPRPPFEEAFWAKVEKTKTCWLWKGALHPAGYGSSWSPFRQRVIGAHRVAYEMKFGPVPKGMHLDHVYARGCRYRNCVNPEHLEIVTPRENALRRIDFSHFDKIRARTHCKAGHEYTPDNLRYKSVQGGRYTTRACKECMRITAAKRRKRRLAKGLTTQGTLRKAIPTHCPKGHEFTPENTARCKRGWRSCLECRRARKRAQRKHPK